MNRRLSLLFILIISLLLAFSGCTAGNGEASSSDLQEEPERNLTDLIQGDPALQIVYAFGLSASPHNTAGGRELYHWLQTEQAVNYLEAYRIGDFPQQIWEKSSGFSLQSFTIAATDKYHDTVNLVVSKALMQSEILQDLIHVFETEYGYSVTIYAAPEEALLEQLQSGNADVIMAEHAVLENASQKSLMDESEGKPYIDYMQSEYILCGPATDPAGVLVKKDISTALKAICDTHSPYLLPTQDEGLMVCQNKLWEQALGVAVTDAAAFDAEPFAGWLVKTDRIGLEALAQAEEKNAYLFAERSVFLYYCKTEGSQNEEQ